MDSSLSSITFTKTPGCRQSAKNLSATKITPMNPACMLWLCTETKTRVTYLAIIKAHEKTTIKELRLWHNGRPSCDEILECTSCLENYQSDVTNIRKQEICQQLEYIRTSLQQVLNICSDTFQREYGTVCTIISHYLLIPVLCTVCLLCLLALGGLSPDSDTLQCDVGVQHHKTYSFQSSHLLSMSSKPPSLTMEQMLSPPQSVSYITYACGRDLTQTVARFPVPSLGLHRLNNGHSFTDLYYQTVQSSWISGIL